MRWVTRSDVHLDRVASPWLIKRFIDPDAEFLFVEPPTEWPQDAIPFALPGAEIGGHDENGTTFEKLIARYDVQHPALPALVEIIRTGVRTSLELEIGEISEETAAIAHGLRAITEGIMIANPDDQTIIDLSTPVYDALLAYFWGRGIDPREESVTVFWDRMAALRARWAFEADD